MEQTEIYVIKRYLYYSFHSSYEIIGYVTSKEDAEVYVYKMNSDKISDSYLYFSERYSFENITPVKVETDRKTYQKIIKNKIAEKEKEIKEKQECSNKDNKAIESLQKEIAHYQSKLE